MFLVSTNANTANPLTLLGNAQTPSDAEVIQL